MVVQGPGEIMPALRGTNEPEIEIVVVLGMEGGA
jgi:hypothetical protein